MSIIATVLDTETTGLHPDKGDEIIEVCASLVNINEGITISTIVQRFMPNKKINPKAEAVHGISMDDLRGEKSLDLYWPVLYDYINQGDVIVAHNAEFDMSFLEEACGTYGTPSFDQPIFCTMQSGRWSTFSGELPNLSKLCFASGVGYDSEEAHAAQYDVDKTVQCLLYGYKSGVYTMPKIEFDALPEKAAA